MGPLKATADYLQGILHWSTSMVGQNAINIISKLLPGHNIIWNVPVYLYGNGGKICTHSVTNGESKKNGEAKNSPFSQLISFRGAFRTKGTVRKYS